MKIKHLVFGLAFLSCVNVRAELNQNDCVRAVIGEGAGEPYKCQVALCAVIRNRGSLKGIYGFNSKHINREPKYIFKQVNRAWLESAKYDPTHGANMFGGICDDWYFINKLKLRPIMTIGHTRFYKG